MMKRVPLSTKRAPHYARSITDRAGFLIMKVEGRQLLWVTIDGRAHEIECESLAHVLEVLAQPELVERFHQLWVQSPDGCEQEDHSLEAFSLLWAKVLADVESKCSRWEGNQSVSERVKKQLLWAFDADGTLDASRFLTILKHEHVNLSREQLLHLVSDLIRKPLFPFFKPHLN